MLDELFAEKSAIKVMEFLIIHERWAQSQKDICAAVGIYSRDAKKIIDRLLKYDIVRTEKKIGKSVLYALNTENVIVRSIRMLLNQFTQLYYEKNYIRKDTGTNEEKTTH